MTIDLASLQSQGGARRVFIGALGEVAAIGLALASMDPKSQLDRGMSHSIVGNGSSCFSVLEPKGKQARRYTVGVECE